MRVVHVEVLHGPGVGAEWGEEDIAGLVVLTSRTALLFIEPGTILHAEEALVETWREVVRVKGPEAAEHVRTHWELGTPVDRFCVGGRLIGGYALEKVGVHTSPSGVEFLAYAAHKEPGVFELPSDFLARVWNDMLRHETPFCGTIEEVARALRA